MVPAPPAVTESSWARVRSHDHLESSTPQALAPRRHPGPALAVELPVLALLLSTVSFRAREAVELAAHPLDGVAILALTFTGIAGLLGFVALLSPVRASVRKPVMTLPTEVYALYVFIAAVGVLVSSMPFLTAYRVLQLVVTLTVLTGAVRCSGSDALLRIERVLIWWATIRLTLVWGGVLFSPQRALEQVGGPFAYRIEGVYPPTPSNTVGTFAVLLVAWSLARLLRPGAERSTRRWSTWALSAFGFVTLLGSQYRTGYAALAVAIALLLIVRRGQVLGRLLLGLLVVVALAGTGVLDTSEQYVLRGQSLERATELSGRVNWWSLVLPVWEQSPVIGAGLRTASRLALGQAGFGDVGTIHSTWVEALVGTGLLGVAFLAGSLLLTWRRAVSEARLPSGRLAPLLLVAVITVRSLTGTSIEDAGYLTTLFLVIGFSLTRHASAPKTPSATRSLSNDP